MVSCCDEVAIAHKGTPGRVLSQITCMQAVNDASPIFCMATAVLVAWALKHSISSLHNSHSILCCLLDPSSPLFHETKLFAAADTHCSLTTYHITLTHCANGHIYIC